MTDEPPGQGDGVGRSSNDTVDARAAIDELYRFAYEELSRRAAALRRGDPFTSLSTRTLVHETWLKLTASPRFGFMSRDHLTQIVVKAMRQVLVDNARHRRAGKRDGIHVTADESIPLSASPADQVLAVHEALTKLEALDATQARIVEDHFFGGLSFAEIAEHLRTSESTVRRKWKDASLLLRVWLDEPRQGR